MRRVVNPGDHFGLLTVAHEVEPGKHGQRRYKCICKCGQEVEVDRGYLYSSQLPKCLTCSRRIGGMKKKIQFVGKKVNGWEILREARHTEGKYLYECRCLTCGEVSIRSTGQINVSRSARCEKCKPTYNFEVAGNIATGRLPCGTEFVIDEDMIQCIGQHYMHMGKDGYILIKTTSEHSMFLHRYIAGVSNRSTMIDHINRDRLDNRRSNLRVVTPIQNSRNHSLFSTNKTGFTGVYLSKWAKRYDAKVGYKNKRIFLGSSKHDIIRLAQMYNIAAAYLYGDYAGEFNDVPPPDDILITIIQKKCDKYKKMMDAKTTLSTEGAVAI